jgi:hypothetical protein
MGEFVDDKHFGPTRKSGIEVKLGQQATSIFNLSSWQYFQTCEQRFGFRTLVRLDNPYNDIKFLFQRHIPGDLEHAVGLPYPWRKTKKNAQTGAFVVFLSFLDSPKQDIGIRSTFVVVGR